jgi:hypothetical protein
MADHHNKYLIVFSGLVVRRHSHFKITVNFEVKHLKNHFER